MDVQRLSDIPKDLCDSWAINQKINNSMIKFVAREINNRNIACYINQKDKEKLSKVLTSKYALK